MLQNAYFLANIGADTAENERNLAEIWQFWQILAPRDDGDQEDQRRVREGVRRPRSADWATRQSARGVVPEQLAK